MPQLRDAIRNLRTPQTQWDDKLRALIYELERIKEQAKKDIQNAISEAKDEAIFGDIEPAKEAGRRAAKEEIASFKGDVTEKIRSIMERIETSKKETYAKVDRDMNTAFDSFMSEVERLLSATVKEMGTQFSGMDSKYEDLSTTARERLNTLIQDTEANIRSMRESISTLRGPQGENGKDGKDGKDGSPDTPRDIADKLNTLNEAVDIKTIKGLDARLKSIKASSTQGRGGGMGNVQHETKSVSSGTTSVQTTYSIAANGYAIWAYYQGQLIVRGTHYTVGTDTRTLSLTFTPDDNTSIDIIYMRG